MLNVAVVAIVAIGVVAVVVVFVVAVVVVVVVCALTFDTVVVSLSSLFSFPRFLASLCPRLFVSSFSSFRRCLVFFS